MSTNFFERQASARRSTGWLILAFGFATIAVVVTITAVVAVGLAASQAGNVKALNADNFPWPIPIMAGLATLTLILGGSFFRILQLRAGGGEMVAESQGGVRIYPDATDPLQRRVLNVVEEMAIAAGTSVPPVYFLPNEPGINAFAAGYSPSDAVIGVTRGAAEELTREELQGVVAHEFSHILNADMKIGIRLMGILYGLLLLGLIGQMVLRATAYSGMGRNRDSKSGGAIMVIMLIAVVAIVLGFVGTFFGNLIKAAVSRQRERLADASGVQFTRNPAGLAGALKRIGALENGSKLNSPNAADASHLFFAEGVWTNLAGLWSTHPPLPERILALDPSWDGVFPAPHAGARTVASELQKKPARTIFNRRAFSGAAFAGGSPANATSGQSTDSGESTESRESRELTAEIPLPLVRQASEHIGNPTEQHYDYAESIIAGVPDELLAAAREPYSSRAIVYGLLLHELPNIREQQFEILRNSVEPYLMTVIQQLAPLIDRIDARARLPLIDLALPALDSMTKPQYRQFSQAFNALVAADGQLELFEWTLAQVIRRNLQARFEQVRPPRARFDLGRFPQSCAIVFSAVAFAGNSESIANRSFAAALEFVPELKIGLQSRTTFNMTTLQTALKELEQTTAAERVRLIRGCAAAISADRHATIEEVELLRGISDLLGCPMPPLLVENAPRG